jgi:LemA protein
MGPLIVIVVILVILVIVGVAVASAYNKFVSQRNLIQESWRQIDVELRRRYDLIPQLVETVRGYATHESNTLTELTRLRSAAVSAPQSVGAGEKAETEQAISTALRSVMVSVEAYPDLKANTNFLELQRQLAETEDRIAAGRRYYNANVRAYNTRLESFPSSFIGNFGKFTPADYFELDDAATERQPPKVDFSGLSGGAPAAVTPTTGQPGDGLPPSVREPAAQPDAIDQRRPSDPNAGPPQG